MGLRRAFVVSSAVLLVGTSPAAAATWFASPSGSGAAPCAAANPCSFTTAITNAPADTEVVVAAGSYNINGQATNNAKLNVHGPATGALPVITQSSQTDSALIVGAGSTVSRLKLVKPTGPFAVVGSLGETVFDQLIVETDVSGATAVQLSDGDVLRDSVVTAPPAATTVTGVLAETPSPQKPVELRNDTIDVPGTGGIAVSAKSPCFVPNFMTFTCVAGAATTMDLRNVLARGAGADLQVTYALFPTDPSTINVDHSNYRPGHVDAQAGHGTINDKGANQSTEPTLTADFHELPGSVTIDAGATDQSSGPFDLDGNLRAFGPPDIGAYDVPEPPTVSLAPVTNLTPTGVTLAGIVDSRNAPTSYHFVYGTTASYGSVAPLVPGPLLTGTTPTAVGAALTGLRPHTTYHYALTASNAAGTQTTADATFTTAAPPPPPLPPHLSTLALTNATFAVAAAITPVTATTSALRHPRGTEFLFRLDRPASVRIAITTTKPGRRSHGRCVAPTRRLRHDARCTRTITLAVLTRSAHAGLNSTAFTGRVPHTTLHPGHYRAMFTARNAGGSSRSRSLSFTIVRR